MSTRTLPRRRAFMISATVLIPGELGVWVVLGAPVLRDGERVQLVRRHGSQEQTRFARVDFMILTVVR